MAYSPQSTPARMLISEFAEATGLSRDTIRFYVRKGLLRPVVGSNDTNRYRTFDASDAERAIMIRSAQSLGFTLREIAALDAEFERTGMTIYHQIELLRERVAAIDGQIVSLRSVRRYLEKKIAWLEDGGSEPRPPLAAGLGLPKTPMVRRTPGPPRRSAGAAP